MALNNTLRTQVDLPVWEWLRFAPAVSSATSTACSADNSLYHPNHGRYIYYLIGTNSFWRYDTITDTYLQLANPPYTPTTASSMRFAGAVGYYGRVISATSNTINSSTHYGEVLKGFDIRIVSGTGAGQQRLITGVSDPVSADSGIATAVSSTTSLLQITDSTKNWAVNQWVGYQVRITYGSGISQTRKILYNNNNILTFGDVNLFATNPWDAMAPLAAAVSSTAGSQTVYSIESANISVDSNWLIQPDATSRFMVQSGGVFLYTFATGIAAYYDIVTDTWYYRSTTNLSAGTPTDITMERQTENATVWEKSVATSGTTTTLVDNNRQWTANQFTGYYVRIYSGTGENQLKQIVSNTTDTLTWTGSVTAPDSTSRYLIEGLDAGTATGGTSSTIVDSVKSWSTDRWKNMSIYITSGTGAGQSRSVVSNTGTTLTISPAWNTNPDTTSTYKIQGDSDKLFVMYGGQSAVMVHNLERDSMSYGREYENGLCRIGSARFGSDYAMPITSTTRSGTTATVTTTVAHNFKTGQSITHLGATGADASLYNVAAAITTVSPTSYTYTMSGTPTANAVFTATTTTTLVDAAKNWTTNQWVGYIVYMNTNQTTPGTSVNTGQAFRITANTSNTLTLQAAGTAPANGVSRYVIATAPAIGAIESGLATGTQSTTTIQDTSKSWVVNIFAGRRVRFTSGTGMTQEATISSNTSNTLTLSAAVTTAAVTANTTYSILGIPARGAGIELHWNQGSSDSTKRGKYMFVARGGALSGFDRLNLSTDIWDNMIISPQSETLTTGSMYTYDGKDRIYFTKENTMRCYYLDINTNMIHGAGMYPYAAGTAIIGNRMEIFETPDHLKYIWLNRHSNTECFRCLLFY
jgi:hypothetical protein